MAYFPLNSQQNIPSQEIQRNFVGGELSVWDYFIRDWLQGGSWRALFCFPVWIISSVRDIRADVWSGRLGLFSRDTAGCPRKSHVHIPVHSISKTLFIWDILRIFVPVARDGRLKGWKLSTAPGGDRLYSWLHWHLTDLLLSPLSIVLVLLSPTESCRFASSRFWAQMTAAWLWGGKCHWKYISYHFHFYSALEWKWKENLLVMSITFCGVCVTCPRRGGGRARGRGRVSWSGGTREPAAAGTLERGLNSDLNTALITFLWSFWLRKQPNKS